MRVLLTGAAGFLGRHVLDRLLDIDDVYLTLLDSPQTELPRGMRRLRCDLSSQEAAFESLRDKSYDVLLHCAREPIGDYARLQAVNALGTKNLLTALEDRVPRVIVAGSCAVYGESIDGAPLDEYSYVEPMTVYGRSMAAREALAREMTGLYGTELCILRFFYLLGPEQEPVTTVPSLARDLVRMKLGLAKPRLRTESLDRRRDYVDVRDAASACLMALGSTGRLPERVNIASGRARTIRSIFTAMAGTLALDPEVEEDPVLPGPEVVLGDPALAESSLGWKPETNISVTLKDLLQSWIRRLRNPSSSDM